ncbi:MAG: ATP synthase F1 subunit delta [Gemmatimonadales bacterium]|mgnify:FL=1|nr:ATP synthase F1 subunit delta [Gemmatimonadales bacterium]MDG2240984.1 ATP synthase F1 subunit delta [Longimicrobiales bacterium]MBT3499737.1 ATP synthase F1 subunit delta [Gemmatimonadales bacterium]MBT3776185.1 ATP synthase F1 subunit delta [Gemmatimonadales bacterium]MBT3957135.1 ATP synthase F1 subunit delta [Gemmatimonadales bacterium]
MRDETVAKNYAETLFELAHRNDGLEQYGQALHTVADLINQDSKFRAFLETPRIDDGDKKDVVRSAFGDALPKHVVNFVMVAIDKRRQRLLRAISSAYNLLLDAHMGREHVEVTVAREVDESTKQMIAEGLSKAFGKEAIPHIRVKPEILGGLLVRTGDTIYDGSVRRRLEGMRRKMLQAHMPEATASAAEA